MAPVLYHDIYDNMLEVSDDESERGPADKNFRFGFSFRKWLSKILVQAEQPWLGNACLLW